MVHYYEGDERTVKQALTGRMSVSELRGLLTHLSNDYDVPWLDELSYHYNPDTNVTTVVIKLVKDRPHTQLK